MMDPLGRMVGQRGCATSSRPSLELSLFGWRVTLGRSANRHGNNNQEGETVPRRHFGFWESVPVVVGLVCTVVIAVLAYKQLGLFGHGLPFQLKDEKPTIGETGDFIGGWANSVALVWLVVVALLQFIALGLQRTELRETREEIKKQVDLMEAQRQQIAAQTETTKGMLELDRKRTAVDFVLSARPRLRALVVEAVQFRAEQGAIRQEVPKMPLRELIRMLAEMLRKEIRSETPLASRRTQVQHLADDILEIKSLFDAVRTHSEYLADDTLYASLTELKDVSSFYDRCVMIQKLIADFKE